ncbi:hypothetical protein C5167_029346, partial [Papaver somniferum]
LLLFIHEPVQGQVLDFDLEKKCSSSDANLNVYACLVCGKYYQGRGPNTRAHTHSHKEEHHVYVNLQTEIFYCLPDGYEIFDLFRREQTVQLDKNKQWSRALDGSDYFPGMMGLDNLKGTDFVNVIIQSLMRVTLLRNIFLKPENYLACTELQRPVPHQKPDKSKILTFLNLSTATNVSKKEPSDPVEFMSWLLETLHADLRSSSNTSIISKCFQGELEVVKEHANVVMETTRRLFLVLELDVPPPLFKNVMENYILPQVPLFNILKKFDGDSITEVVSPSIARMRFRVTRLPQYLVVHMHRFTKNNFFLKKNLTLGKSSLFVDSVKL